MLAVANPPGRDACGQFLADGCVLDSKGVAYIILWIRELDNPFQDFGREPPSEVERNSRESSVADALPQLARCLEEAGNERPQPFSCSLARGGCGRARTAFMKARAEAARSTKRTCSSATLPSWLRAGGTSCRLPGETCARVGRQHPSVRQRPRQRFTRRPTFPSDAAQPPYS